MLLLFFLVMATLLLFHHIGAKNNTLKNKDYLEVQLITNKYGIICLKNRQFLVSVFPPVGETKIYEGNDEISQFIDEDGDSTCISKSFSESDVINNPNQNFVYNDF